MDYFLLTNVPHRPGASRGGMKANVPKMRFVHRAIPVYRIRTGFPGLYLLRMTAFR